MAGGGQGGGMGGGFGAPAPGGEQSVGGGFQMGGPDPGGGLQAGGDQSIGGTMGGSGFGPGGLGTAYLGNPGGMPYGGGMGGFGGFFGGANPYGGGMGGFGGNAKDGSGLVYTADMGINNPRPPVSMSRDLNLQTGMPSIIGGMPAEKYIQQYGNPFGGAAPQNERLRLPQISDPLRPSPMQQPMQMGPTNSPLPMPINIAGGPAESYVNPIGRGGATPGGYLNNPFAMGRYGRFNNLRNLFSRFKQGNFGNSQPVTMRGGGIASLGYADGGKVGYEDLGAKLPRTEGTSGQDTYNRVMALGSSPEYEAYYNSLPSHLRAYAAPPASGPNDPNWAYQAAQERNQFEVNQGMDAFSPQAPAGAGGYKSMGAAPSAGSRPVGSLFGDRIGRGRFTGVDFKDRAAVLDMFKNRGYSKSMKPLPKDDGGGGGNGGEDTPTPTEPTPYEPTPSPVGVSENYKPYKPPTRRVYTPNSYSYKPAPGSQIGRNPTPNSPEQFIWVPTPIPGARQVPGSSSVPVRGNQGITGLMK